MNELRDHLLRIWRHGAFWAVAWLISRAWMFWEWARTSRFIWNDVRYYYGWMVRDDLGMNRLYEYPAPVVWILKLIELPTHEVGDYIVLFGLTMAVLDAALTIALFRTGSMRAVMFWVVFVTAFGGLIWFRYDMVPALVVGLAALYVTKHPRLAGGLVAVGAALKLWPAMLIAPLLGRHRAGRQRLLWFGIAGLALALLALVTSGPQRLLSPLQWQSQRGLQIEAVPATYLMWRRVRDASWQVSYGSHNAYEIFGPQVSRWINLADLAMVVVIACAAGMALIALTRKSLPADVLTLMMVAVVAGMLVANKTFSPQYLVWLAAPVAAMVVEARTRFMYLLAATCALVCIALAWLTHQVYPLQYAGLIQNPFGGAEATQLLVVRNVLIAALWILTQLAALGVLLTHHHSTKTTVENSPSL